MNSLQQTTYKHYIGAVICKRLYKSPTKHKTIIIKDRNDIYIAIKGTSTIIDWRNNLHLKKNAIDVHQGFSDYAQDCFKEIQANNLIEDCYDVDNVIISSHSSGACAAVVILYHLMTNNKLILKGKNIDLIMFGSPKPGGKIFRSQFQELCKDFNINMYRYVNNDDIVPNLPPFGYFHHICEESALKDITCARNNIYKDHCMDAYITNLFNSL
jgi:predicted lipase